MDGRFVELDGPGVPPHCMDHIYYAMSLRSQRRMGGHLVPSQGPINHDGSSSVNTVLVGSTGCHACGLRFGQIARKRCPCGLVAYCSAGCQRTDWSAHKARIDLRCGCRRKKRKGEDLHEVSTPNLVRRTDLVWTVRSCALWLIFLSIWSHDLGRNMQREKNFSGCPYGAMEIRPHGYLKYLGYLK